MKSKRSDYRVVSGACCRSEMYIFEDGSKCVMHTICSKDLIKLGKETIKRKKKLKKGFFMHLTPEISFFCKE